MMAAYFMRRGNRYACATIVLHRPFAHAPMEIGGVAEVARGAFGGFLLPECVGCLLPSVELLKGIESTFAYFSSMTCLQPWGL